MRVWDGRIEGGAEGGTRKRGMEGGGLLKERLISVSAVLMLVVTSLTHPSIYLTLKCRSDVCTNFLVFILFLFASQLHVTQESDRMILLI
jgi:hypothetical protein